MLTKTNQKKATVDVSISKRADFRVKSVVGEKDRQYRTRGPFSQETEQVSSHSAVWEYQTEMGRAAGRHGCTRPLAGGFGPFAVRNAQSRRQRISEQGTPGTPPVHRTEWACADHFI